MNVLIIDNYDSFTFNLYQYVGEILQTELSQEHSDSKVTVKRNNEITLEQIKQQGYDNLQIMIAFSGSVVDPDVPGMEYTFTVTAITADAAKSPAATVSIRAESEKVKAQVRSDLSFWSWRWDLNPRPIDYESIALPLRHSSSYLSIISLLRLFVNRNIEYF